MSSIAGINVAAPIAPFDTADNQASHKAVYGLGGLRTVADSTARNAIYSNRAEEGMLVYQQNDGFTYQLLNGFHNPIVDADWKKMSIVGYPFDTIPTSALAGGSSGPDIFVDGGFEIWTNSSTPTHWAPGQIVGTGTVAQESTIKYSGNYSNHISGSAVVTPLLTDGALEIWTSSSVLTYWNNSIGNGSPVLSQEAVVVHGGLYSAKIVSAGLSGPDILGLESNLITGRTPGANVQISFWATNNGDIGNATGGAFIVNDTVAAATQLYNFGTQMWDTLTVGTIWAAVTGTPSAYIAQIGGNPTTWTNQQRSFSVPASGSYEMVVMGVPTGSNAYTIYFDDLEMNEDPVLNIAFTESDPLTSLTPGKIYNFKGYQRNDTGTGNGSGVALFFNGTTTGTATQIYKFGTTNAWVTWVDWATTIFSSNTGQDFFAQASEATTFTAWTASVPVPANGTLVAAVSGVFFGGGGGSATFSVYIDACTLGEAPASILFPFVNHSDPANIVGTDVLVDFHLDGGAGAHLLQLKGSGEWITDFGTFNYSSKPVEVGAATSGSHAINKTYFDTNMFVLPTQTGHANEFLTTNGFDPSWVVPTLVGSAFANQGTNTTLLHGNAVGGLSWGAVNLGADVTGTLSFGYGGTGNTTFSAYGIVFANGSSQLASDSNLQWDFNNHLLGINLGSAPSAYLHLGAGTASANTAPLKFTPGTNLGTPESGSIEYDGSNWFASPSTTRNILAQIAGSTAMTTGSIGFFNASGFLTQDNSNLFWDATAANLGVGTSSPTARLHLGAGGIAAGTAALKFSAGYFLTTPEDGVLEFNGTVLDLTTAGVRRSIVMTAGTANPGLGEIVFGTGTGFVEVDGNNLFWDYAHKRLGLGTNTPTAFLQLTPGDTPAGSGPIKWVDGPLLTTPEEGVMEYHSGYFYITDNTNRYLLITGTNNAQTIYGDMAFIGRNTCTTAVTTASSNLGLGSTNNFFVLGNTQIDLIDNTDWKQGGMLVLAFGGTPTIKHNQTASGTNKSIMLANSVDFVILAAGATLTLMWDYYSDVWRETSRTIA